MVSREYKYTPQSMIYLLRVGEGWRPIYKIGSSSKPEKRRYQIQRELNVPVVILATYYVGWHAQNLEQAWHKFFRPLAIKPHRGSKMREWFQFTERDIRLFKHLSFWTTQRIQANPEASWYRILDRIDMPALRKRLGYIDPKEQFNPS